jgi:phosphoenolpyruvate-protein phosphotransferase
VPVAPGVAIARAYCVDEALARRGLKELDAAAVSAELARLEGACAAARQELDDTIARVRDQVGEQEAAIFRAHRLLLDDPALLTKVQSAILDRHVDARTALQDVQAEYVALFSQIQDAYLRERLADVRDVIGHVQARLAVEDGGQALAVREPVIVVASEILPSQVIGFGQLPVAGIVTEKGGATGHAAILARSLGIPAASGLGGILREVRSGDLLVLDGREGAVFVNPGPEVLGAYHTLQREYVQLRDRLISNREHQPVTMDGTRVELLANVNGPADAALAARAGVSGVGLYRTEYLFLTHRGVPSEEEQLAVYRAVVEAAPNRAVTIRTLDIGGDKHVPYLGTPHQANPFLGWRSTRLSFAYPDLFRAQLRAILRAARYGRVSLLLPMISTLEEIRQCKRMIDQAVEALGRQGLGLAAAIPVGVMVEVPAAVFCIDAFLEEVDFVSIGSNDLIQYVMAADRDNPKVAHLCEPFHPAIFHVLRLIIEACAERGRPVTLCGEMAGRPRCLLPLLGLGLRRLGMSPALVPTIKELVRRATVARAQAVAAQVLRMKTAHEILEYLTRETRELWPEVALLDTRESTEQGRSVE